MNLTSVRYWLGHRPRLTLPFSNMDSTLLIPLLFPTEPGFADLCDGSLIRVARPDGKYIGTLHVTHQAHSKRFGAIVQFGPTSATAGSNLSLTCDQRFAATGHAGVPIHRLTLDELRAITRTDDPKVPFELIVPAG